MTVSHRYLSPLRYPGGKGALAPLLSNVLSINGLKGCEYYEPFAGGAGAALKLLNEGAVTVVHLNDADARIATLWRTIFKHNERLADAVEEANVSVTEWYRQYNIYTSARSHSAFDVAYSTLFLNRCNRSGIIKGARPIGGFEQDGPFKINARFDKKNLAQRIRSISPMASCIRIYNQDALLFLKSTLPKGSARRKVFVYLDPPYYGKGSRLYLNYYSEADHRALARYILDQNSLRWLMSYDDHPAVRLLYAPALRSRINVDYSLQVRRRSRELLIAPEVLTLPRRKPHHSNSG